MTLPAAASRGRSTEGQETVRPETARPTPAGQETGAEAEPRWSYQWRELHEEVILTGLCTGCAGCVIACPHDVIGYSHEPCEQGAYLPFHIEDELGPGDCGHGRRGCTSCTRACPRFRMWEPEADGHLFGRQRRPEELSGIYSEVLLARAADNSVYEVGQDGGLVSAILIWCLENDIIDGALTSGVEPLPDGEPGWKASPMVASSPDEVLQGAGSRYTYSANLMAYEEARERGLSRLALVGMGCQTSVGPVMWHRGVGKVGKAIKLNIGLLCSKAFDDSLYSELFEAEYGLRREDISKIDIKGVVQIWTKAGGYREVSLKECHAWTRQGCLLCPDFSAEHADISTGGIGKLTDWTLTVVRTELGRAVIDAMMSDGVIETRPGGDDPAAVALMHRLSAVSRRRWPAWADSSVSVGLPGRGKPKDNRRRGTIAGEQAPRE